MSKMKVEALLTESLGLRAPIFKLEKIGSKVAGSVISGTFQGKSDRDRQRMLWDALDAALGADAVRQVGTLLAYTPAEWDVDLVKVD